MLLKTLLSQLTRPVLPEGVAGARRQTRFAPRGGRPGRTQLRRPTDVAQGPADAQHPLVEVDVPPQSSPGCSPGRDPQVSPSTTAASSG